MFPLFKQIINYINVSYGMELAQFKIGLLLISNGTKITDEVTRKERMQTEVEHSKTSNQVLIAYIMLDGRI